MCDEADAARDALRVEAEEARSIIEAERQDRAAAVAIADEAVRAAETLRQVEADRKGRGRLRRAWEAWRGE